MTEIVVPDYHHAAFRRLHELYHQQINQHLVEAGKALRRAFMQNRFEVGVPLSPDEVWDAGLDLLDALETEMSRVTSRRSVFFWLHIYRRIGVALSPKHESNRDPVTLGLVRQIAEQAIHKYSVANNSTELRLSNEVSPNLVLGGWMKKGIYRYARKPKSRAFDAYAALLRSNPNWVVASFSKLDFLHVYRLEGLAYQYWMVTALMRSAGKGASVRLTEQGDWIYIDENKLESLFISFDSRNEKDDSFASLTGGWSASETLFSVPQEGQITSTVFFSLLQHEEERFTRVSSVPWCQDCGWWGNEFPTILLQH